MPEVERKLATILATDVVAFSNMMGRDELGALRSLKSCLELIEESIDAHGGRVFGGAGDSLVAEFSSPSSAVLCAVEFQDRIAERNRGRSELQHMWFRVGIELGEVMVDGDNLYGEGVNIAARLEELGKVAGVCISHKVHEEVRHSLALSFVDCGDHELKNIDHPVRVFHLRSRERDNNVQSSWGGGKASRPTSASTGKSRQPDHSLVLRTFSVAGDEEAEFLAKGLRDGLVRSLSRHSEIGVIHEQSSPNADADYILEGSVRGRSGRLRLTFSLIEAANGTQVWSEQYDRASSDDVFDLEEHISLGVAAAIRVKLKIVEFERLRNASNDELSVGELLRKGAAFFAHGPGENDKAEACLRAAIAREPDNSMGLAMLSYCLFRRFEFSPVAPPAETGKAMSEMAERAVKLKPDSYFAHLVVSILSHDLSGDFDRARLHAEAALDVNPDLLGAHGMIAIVECHLGEAKAGVAALKRVLDVSREDPHRFRHQREFAIANFVSGDLEAASEVIGRLVESDPQMERNKLVQSALLWLQGNGDAAVSLGRQLLENYPNLSGLTKRPVRFGRTEDAARFEAAFSAVGLGKGLRDALDG
ncbi:adenylate/guanylate cyclase domain-containing protein [Roseibium sp. SCP14]|uniref:adenylate/guanylate cyclase domain-containing protein n=1 Tax=Roseibium sp. SCP14 TaxID=3141375 RepID=UPI003335E067